MADAFDNLYNPNAFFHGAEAAQKLDAVRTRNAAAQAFDPMDTQVSQAILNKGGLYDDANALQDRPLEVQKAQLGVQQQQQNLDNGAADQAQQNDKAEWEKVGQVTDILSRIQDSGQDVGAAYDALGPVLQNELGLSPEHYAQIGEQLKADPKGFLTALHQQSLKVVGARVFDENTGKVVIDAPAGSAAKAGKPNIIKDGQGQIWQIITDPEGNAHYQPVTQAQADALTAAPAAAPAAPAHLTEETFADLLNTDPTLHGAAVSSGLRSKADNDRVGGAVRSNHLTGNAADVTPGQGQTMASLYSALQAKGFHLIPEHGNKPSTVAGADHIHVDFNQQNKAAYTQAAAPAATFALKPSPKASGGAAVDIPDDYADSMARMVQRGQALPTGNSAAVVAQRIAIDKAGRRIFGKDWDPVSGAAQLAADKKSLVTTQGRTDTMDAATKAATAASSLVLMKSKDLGLTGLGPYIDGPLLEHKINSGDPKATAYKNFVHTFGDEYARIISQSQGNAATTEGARKEAYDRLNAAFTSNQMAATVAGMKQEMAIKQKENAQKVTDIKGRIKGAPAASDGGWSIER